MIKKSQNQHPVSSWAGLSCPTRTQPVTAHAGRFRGHAHTVPSSQPLPELSPFQGRHTEPAVAGEPTAAGRNPLPPLRCRSSRKQPNTEAPMPGGGPPVQSRRTKPQRPRQWHGSSAARVCRAAEAARSGHQPSPPPPSRGLTIRSYSGLAVRPPNRVASPLPSSFHLYTGRGSHGLARTRAEVVVAAAVLVKLDGTV